MELVEYNCPNCTATLHINAEKCEAVCEYCGSKFQIEDKNRNAEREGYEFEKGRIRAREEMGAGAPIYTETPAAKKTNRLWLWILGWIFFFPIPLTVLIVKSKMSTPIKIVLIVILWGFVFYVGITGDTDNAGSSAQILFSFVL